jgi:hypothetical protein
MLEYDTETMVLTLKLLLARDQAAVALHTYFTD